MKKILNILVIVLFVTFNSTTLYAQGKSQEAKEKIEKKSKKAKDEIKGKKRSSQRKNV